MLYDVKRRLTYDGKRYLPGSEVPIKKEKTAKELLDLGVIAKKGQDTEAEAKAKAKAKAEAEAKAKAEAEAQKKAEDLIKQAIKDGKVLSADEKVWLNSALQDYDATKKTLDAKAKVEVKK